MNTDGTQNYILMTEANSISLPKTLAVYDKRLFYLDPRYDKLERLDINMKEDGTPEVKNAKLLLDNEPDLKTFTIFWKRTGRLIEFVVLFLINNFVNLKTRIY